MRLINPTNRELDVALAQVIGAPVEHDWHETIGGLDYCPKCAQSKWPDHMPPCQPPRYSMSADAILPHLEARPDGWHGYVDIRFGRQAVVTVFSNDAEIDESWHGIALTFPMAATIALLRAHGVEVVLDAQPVL